MPDQWTLSIVVPIYKMKGDIRNCSCNRATKLLEHGNGVIKKRRRIVNVNEMQFGSTPERGTSYAVFIW